MVAEQPHCQDTIEAVGNALAEYTKTEIHKAIDRYGLELVNATQWNSRDTNLIDFLNNRGKYGIDHFLGREQ